MRCDWFRSASRASGIVVGMAILPFLAIALMFIPFDVIVEDIAKLLL